MQPNTVKKVKRKGKKRRRSIMVRMLISALGLVLAMLVFFGVLWYLIGRQPAEYNPRYLTQEEKKWANDLGTYKYNQLFNKSYIDEKFTLSLEQQLVNALLMMDDDIWGYRRNFPTAAKYFQDAQVAFHKERIHLMGRVTYEGVNTVMTIVLEPKIATEGKLQIRLDSVKAGALKIPDGIVNQKLVDLLKTLKVPLKQVDSDGENNHYYIDSKELTDDLGLVTLRLSSRPQLTTDAVFKSTEDTKIRIEDIKISPGELELAVQPTFIDK